MRKPAEIRRRRTPLWMVIVLVLAILLALFFARNYHVFGLEVLVVGGSDRMVAVLIDFPPGNA